MFLKLQEAEENEGNFQEIAFSIFLFEKLINNLSESQNGMYAVLPSTSFLITRIP